MDCADNYTSTKAMFQAGTSEVSPVDKFDAWCEQRGSFQASAWFKSWNMNGSHPEFIVLDRDGYVREHKRGWGGDASMDAVTEIVEQLVGVYTP